MTCEYCWAHSEGVDGYYATMARAEAEGWPCTKNTPEGAKLRAGAYWSEEKQMDTRKVVAS